MPILRELWFYQVQAVPVLLGLLSIELPRLLYRLLWPEHYVPVYLAVFPFNHLNRDLSVYLAEDCFGASGEDLTEAEAEKLRRRAIAAGILTALVGGVVIPAFAGFIGTFYMDAGVVGQFLVALGIYKTIASISALRQFKYHAVATRRTRSYLALFYIVYWALVLWIVNSVSKWARPFVTEGRWGELLTNLADLFFDKIVLQFGLFALLSWLLVDALTDRRIRQENLKHLKGDHENDE